MNDKYQKIGIVADYSDGAKVARESLILKYGLINIENSPPSADIDAIIAIGGDGFMLQTLHNYIENDLPIYGLNKGTIGFLMNDFSENNLIDRLNKATDTKIRPLKMECECEDGSIHTSLAINEVSLLRTSGQAAKIMVSVDNTQHIPEMICDGVIVSTPAGSSAYNYSCGGTILPIKSNLQALTPISPFRPRRWRGALLPEDAVIDFEVNKYWKRPVKAVADNQEVQNVIKVKVSQDKSKCIHLLFDKGHSLEERIIKEQFEFC